MPDLRRPYLLFLGDAADRLAAKTAIGIHAWRPAWCAGTLALPGCRVSLPLPALSPAEAVAAGCRTLVIGVANAGGVIGDAWIDPLAQALAAGLDVANGLHQRLADIPRLAAAAATSGARLIEVRIPDRDFPVGTGARRAGRRLLTVGTDCSVGKMYATLALERDMRSAGFKATFRATGQTGILVAGSGVAIDAVVADFIAGAVEWLAPANDADHWDLIEGQGSLFHPSFAGVSLGLLHGAQADALVMCHEPTRPHMRGLPGWPLPEIGRCIAANEEAARLTNPAVRCVGVAVNTSDLPEAARKPYLADLADRLGLPCVDPMIDGTAPLIARLPR
jgi:uncharacterized NAD-dependent epimerase/dehydratase family protein